MTRAAAAALFCFLAHSGAAGAQDAAAVARPDVKAGDRWTYRRMDYGNDKSLGSYELVVTFAERGVIHAVATRKDGHEADATFTSEWNDVVSPGGTINVREKGLLQFPLRAGGTYKVDWNLENPKNIRAAGRHERTVTIVGWEAVSVPAGQFRALRIEAAGSYQRFGTTQTGRVREVFWYAPEVKRWVKHVHEEFRGGRSTLLQQTLGEELVEFKIQ